MKEFPSTARTVVIGGGIVGCSTAYHLGKLGWTDTVLVERHKLTSGTTFHAAGLVGQLRTSANITQLLGNSVKLYNTLTREKETLQPLEPLKDAGRLGDLVLLPPDSVNFEGKFLDEAPGTATEDAQTFETIADTPLRADWAGLTVTAVPHVR